VTAPCGAQNDRALISRLQMSGISLTPYSGLRGPSAGFGYFRPPFVRTFGLLVLGLEALEIRDGPPAGYQFQLPVIRATMHLRCSVV
jgi:hypothetical protein